MREQGLRPRRFSMNIIIKTTLLTMISATVLAGVPRGANQTDQGKAKEPDIVTGQPRASDPKTILANAIKAHGGSKNILKPRRGHLKGIDTVVKKGTSEEWIDLPNQWK